MSPCVPPHPLNEPPLGSLPPRLGGGGVGEEVPEEVPAGHSHACLGRPPSGVPRATRARRFAPQTSSVWTLGFAPNLSLVCPGGSKATPPVSAGARGRSSQHSPTGMAGLAPFIGRRPPGPIPPQRLLARHGRPARGGAPAPPVSAGPGPAQRSSGGCAADVPPGWAPQWAGGGGPAGCGQLPCLHGSSPRDIF